MDETDLSDFAVLIAAIAAFTVAAILVSTRAIVRPEVVAVTLALTVLLAGRLGGRAAALMCALMSAACFDFFHTKPYLSLKISDTSDLLVMALLLVVGTLAASSSDVVG